LLEIHKNEHWMENEQESDHKWTGWTTSLPGLVWDYKTFGEQRGTEQNGGGSSTELSKLGWRKTVDKIRQDP